MNIWAALDAKSSITGCVILCIELIELHRNVIIVNNIDIKNK